MKKIMCQVPRWPAKPKIFIHLRLTEKSLLISIISNWLWVWEIVFQSYDKYN